MRILRCECGRPQRLRGFVEKSFRSLRRRLYSGLDFFSTQALPIRFAKAGSIHTDFTLFGSNLAGGGSMQWATNFAIEPC
jgi:hypothetical protein